MARGKVKGRILRESRGINYHFGIADRRLLQLCWTDGKDGFLEGKEEYCVGHTSAASILLKKEDIVIF